MRKLPFCCAALAIVLALGVTARAHEVIYSAALTGPNEFPPNSSPATGAATVTVDLDILTMRVQADFTGLTGNTTAAHIHGPIPDPPANPLAGVVTAVPSFPDFPLGVALGTYDKMFDLTDPATYNPDYITANGGTIGGAMNAFLVNLDAGKMYFNIHSTAFSGGEIRGFLNVPEPTGLASLGAIAVGISLRRRR